MFDEKTEELQRLLYLCDMLVSFVAFTAAYTLRDFLTESSMDIYSHVAILPLFLFLFTVSLTFIKAYQGLRIASISFHSWSLFKALTFSTIAMLVILYLMNVTYVSRLFLISFTGTYFVMLILVRIILISGVMRKSLKKNENNVKILIIGIGERAKRLAEVVEEHSTWGMDIVGHIDIDEKHVGEPVGNGKVIGTVEEISDILKKHVIDEVILAIPRDMITDVEDIAYACEEEGVKFRLMADMFDLQVARMRLVNLEDIPLLTFEPVALNEGQLVVKRLVDLVLTLGAMPLIAPLLLMVALAIKLDSKGPVFFVQQRVGLRKRLFPMFKFRSMYIDAEERLKEIEHLNEAEGPIFKMKDDPRVTRVGKFIRKTSLDELPQLFNVIRGEMSLVGPRPMSIRDVELFDKGIQRKRFSVKPGITCIWQVSGRSNLPFEKWLELDLQYISNWSLGLDIQILLKTLPAVLKSDGSY